MKKEFSLDNQNGMSLTDMVLSVGDQNGKSSGTEIYGIIDMNGVSTDQTACYHLLNENGVG